MLFFFLYVSYFGVIAGNIFEKAEVVPYILRLLRLTAKFSIALAGSS